MRNPAGPVMRLSIDRLWLVLAVLLPALIALLVPLPAVDLAYQVRAGDEILRTGALPGVDTYTFTIAGTPWTDQQWLAQVLLAVGYRLGGWELLAVLRAALVAGAFGLLAWTAMLRGAGPRTAAVLSLIAFALAAPALALRPQLFGIELFATLLMLAAARVRSPRVWWFAPLLVAMWANLHGSFVVAPLLLGYVWLDDLVRGRRATASLVVLLTGTVATFVNPYGPDVWFYAAGIGASPLVTQQVSEWQRTTPLTVPGLLFYASAVAALVVAWRGRVALRWPDWLWLAGLFAVGVWTIRGVAWWPFGAAYALAPTLAALGASRVSRPTIVGALVAAVLGLAVVAALPWWRPSDRLAGRAGLLTYAPSGLAASLQAAAASGSRVFVPQDWASWFEWAVPDARYFVDSRFELLGTKVWNDYEIITAVDRGWSNVLDDRDVAWVVTESNSRLLEALQSAAGWCALYSDENGFLFKRKLETGPSSCTRLVTGSAVPTGARTNGR